MWVHPFVIMQSCTDHAQVTRLVAHCEGPNRQERAQLRMISAALHDHEGLVHRRSYIVTAGSGEHLVAVMQPKSASTGGSGSTIGPRDCRTTVTAGLRSGDVDMACTR